MFRIIKEVLGDNLYIMIVILLIILMTGRSHAEGLQITTSGTAVQLDTCRHSANTLEKTDLVIFSGEMLTDGDWSVPYSTVTVTFADGTELVWSPRTVALERKPALMDWIATALSYQEDTGYPPLAKRDPQGQVWLVSPYLSSGKIRCLAQPLDIPVLH